MYATYDFYIGEYMGNAITSHDWARLEKKAADYIDYLTMGRAASYDSGPEVKNAVCAIAEQIQTMQAAETAARAKLEQIGTDQEMSSESVGSYSVSYRSGTDQAAALRDIRKEAEAECDRLAAQYLLRTGLLYRGIPMRGC